LKILWLTWKDRDHPQSGGAEVVNEELAARLAADGHDVVFITAGFKNYRPNVTRRGFRIVRVGSRYTTYLAAPVEYFRRWRHWPDLVIDECNTMPYFARLYTGRPTLMFFHMLCREIWFYQFPQPLSTIGWLLEPLYLRLLPKRAIAMSDSTKRDLLRHGFRTPDVHVISEGITTKPVQDLTKIKKFSNPTILSFGTIRPMKRTLHQIKAFELAKLHIPDLTLKVAGDASTRYGRQVLDYIARSPHSADIEYVGRPTDEQRLQLMQRAHLILQTSIKEGWGLTVTEAASQGTPAIVYHADGLRDSVRHDRTGLITPPNPQAMATAITELLADPKRYDSVRHAAWEWSKEITFDRSYQDFLSVLSLSSTTSS
jgi:glycosyltransferase involved in cell wall biosynthesis